MGRGLEGDLGLLFLRDQLDQAAAQLLGSHLDVVALAGLEQGLLTAHQLPHPLLEQGRELERAADLTHELLGEGFCHGGLCFEGRRRVGPATIRRKGLAHDILRGRYR